MRSIVLLGYLATFLGVAPAVAGQEVAAPSADAATSASLQRHVKPGDTLRVVTHETVYAGKLSELSQSGVVLRSKAATHRVELGDISTVYKHHTRGEDLGATIGTIFGVAFAVGYAAWGCPHEALPVDCQLSAATYGAMFFGGLGAGVGAATGWSIDRLRDRRPVFKESASRAVTWTPVTSKGSVALNIGGVARTGHKDAAVAVGITVRCRHIVAVRE